MLDDSIAVTVADTRVEPARLVVLRLRAGACVRDALAAYATYIGDEPSGLQRADAGIFGRRCADDEVLHDGDRVEMYRPLDVDPKAARRRRAQLKSARRPAD